MPYIGNTPADKFLTLAKQNFSTSATTSYTLDSAVSSTQDIALFINNVRQSPVDAYSVSGTALTLTSATAGTDEMYCVYLGKTVGTVSPSANSITNAMMTDDSVGLAELSATGTPSSSNFLRGDNAWATAGGNNTPAFKATAGTTDQSIANNTWVKVNLGTEIFDTDSAFASDKFTVPAGEGGKYMFGYGVTLNNLDDQEKLQIRLYKNGSEVDDTQNRVIGSRDNQLYFVQATQVLDLSASDYIELYMTHEEGGSQDTRAQYVFLYGYKLIGV